MAAYKPSFTDAKLTEDIAENLVGVDFANDGAKVVEGFADILWDEVGRGTGVKAVLNAIQGALRI